MIKFTLKMFFVGLMIVGLGVQPTQFAMAQAPDKPSAEDVATAEIIFKEALKLMSQNKFNEACPKLEDVVRLIGGLGAKMQLAKCYTGQGKTGSAWSVYREVVSLARAQNQSQRANDAAEGAAALEPKLSKLTIRIQTPANGLEIRRNGVVQVKSLLGLAIPVDPGEHKIEATAPGKVPLTMTVKIPEGPSQTEVVVPTMVGVPVLPSASETTSAPGPSAPPIAPTTEPPKKAINGQMVGGLVLGGVGVVMLGVGVGLGFAAKSKYDSAISSGDCSNPLGCKPGTASKVDSAKTLGTVGTVVGVSGVGLALGGAALFLLAPKSSKMGLIPSVSPYGGGVHWVGHW